MSNEYLEEDVIKALNQAIHNVEEKNKSPTSLFSFQDSLIQEMRKELKKIKY